MKKYKVTATYVVVCEAIIEAPFEEEAWAIANETDGGQFKQIDSGDWEIEDVKEIKE